LAEVEPVLSVVVVQVGVLHLEVSTLVVLLAVLAVVEGLHHLSVLLGGEQLHGPKRRRGIKV